MPPKAYPASCCATLGTTSAATAKWHWKLPPEPPTTCFFFDADDRFNGHFILPPKHSLTADAYSFNMHNQGAPEHQYHRTLMVRNDGGWHWRGAVHEQLRPTDQRPLQRIHLDGDYAVVSGRFGARSRNPSRYADDARLLAAAYHDPAEADYRAENAYFCGQSYRDAGDLPQAVHWLQQSLTHCSRGSELRRHILLELAEQYKALQQEDAALRCLLLAYDNSPHNAEAPFLLAEYFAARQAPLLAFDYAGKSLDCPLPERGTVISCNRHIWQYGRLHVYLYSALQLEHYREAFDAFCRLLALDDYPDYLHPVLRSALTHEPVRQLLAALPDAQRETLLNRIRTRLGEAV